jgi:hypothetical protein
MFFQSRYRMYEKISYQSLWIYNACVTRKVTLLSSQNLGDFFLVDFSNK